MSVRTGNVVHQLTRYGMMIQIASTMPPEERTALEAWEQEHLDHDKIATSDWPGWAKYNLPEPTAPAILKNNNPAIIPIALRWEVWERDNFTCQYCGSRRFLVVDHIYPASKGGATTTDNLQTLCRSCNS